MANRKLLQNEIKKHTYCHLLEYVGDRDNSLCDKQMHNKFACDKIYAANYCDS